MYSKRVYNFAQRPVGRRTILPARWRGPGMTKLQPIENAKLCAQWANETFDDARQTALFDMAESWLEVAALPVAQQGDAPNDRRIRIGARSRK